MGEVETDTKVQEKRRNSSKEFSKIFIMFCQIKHKQSIDYVIIR